MDPPARESPVKREQEEGAHNRHDQPRRLALAVETHHLAEETTQKRTSYAEQDGDNEPAGIPAGHEQLGDNASHKTEEYPPKYAKNFGSSC